MGDRLLMQCIDTKENKCGPVIYCHWSGSSAPDITRRLAERMKERGADLDYASARLVQEAINGDKGALSFGIWNADAPLTAEESHGDAGIVLIDVSDGYKCKCMGGYLTLAPDGFPKY